jgi:hypothetical protein
MPSNTTLQRRTLRFDEFTTLPNRADAVAEACRKAGPGDGGQTLGIFIPLIGVSVNTVTVATTWPDEPPKAYDAGATASDVAAARTRVFDVLARGQEPCPADRPGVYTHRWFVVRAGDAGRLTEQSVEAWKTSEADTAMRVAGFWGSREQGANGEETILMIVYYPDLAAWEASRYWKPPPPQSDQPNREVWGGLFQKRRDLLVNSWVTVHRLAG